MRNICKNTLNKAKRLWIMARYPKIIDKEHSGDRIISFSLWGQNPKYLVGAVENIKLQKILLPDWKCRFYISDDVPIDTAKYIKDSGSQIIRKSIYNGFSGLYWRFEAAWDPTVSRFLVRDCDSRLNIREVAAIKEWIDSSLPFHTMRDHEFHTIPILGGLWGAISGFMPDFETRLFHWLRKLEVGQHARGKFFFSDQDFLTKYVWPRVEHCHMAHTSSHRFSVHDRNFTVTLPVGYFVGQQYDEHDKPVLI